MKRFISLLLFCAMALSMAIPALADADEHRQGDAAEEASAAIVVVDQEKNPLLTLFCTTADPEELYREGQRAMEWLSSIPSLRTASFGARLLSITNPRRG